METSKGNIANAFQREDCSSVVRIEELLIRIHTFICRLCVLRYDEHLRCCSEEYLLWPGQSDQCRR